MTALSTTDYNNLTTRRSTILTELAAMTSSVKGGKPNVDTPGQIDHVGYKDGLYRELREIEALLEIFDGELNPGGSEVISEGTV